uniref:Choloylglycine hydrolase/NAAA C-terminal domain-containing protein n=1 Tax=Clytia hemisphaerica TaxID=252671 RepID=A0A7M5UFP1_9CNID
TDFLIGCQDGATVHGRTMEFEFAFPWVVGVVPKGYKEFAMLPENCQTHSPLTWFTRYKILGIKSAGDFSNSNRSIVDGQNEAGLSAGALWFEGFTEYPDAVPEQHCSHSIPHMQLINYLLGNFSSVEQVRIAFKYDIFPFVWGQYVT